LRDQFYRARGAGIGYDIMLVSVTERTKEIGVRKSSARAAKTSCGNYLTEAVFIFRSWRHFGNHSGNNRRRSPRRWLKVDLIFPYGWASRLLVAR